MVRILGVKHLEERRRLLVARSEIHRQTLRLEIASLKFSALEFKQQFGLLSHARRLLGLAASVAGLFRRQTGSENGRGFVSRLLSGIKFAAELMSLLKKLTTGAAASEEDAVTAPGPERNL